MIVANKDHNRFREIMTLMTEMVWLTNNFIAHVSQDQLPVAGDKKGQTAIALAQGLDHTLIRLVENYLKIEEEI